MNDAVAMSRVECVGDLRGDAHDLIERQTPFLEPGGERLAVQQRHDNEMRAGGFADVEDAADVWMVERSDHPGLALEPDAGVGVFRNVR